ncbi:transposase [[Bacillus] enclensis]|uniref:Uncharacterized protein n=1 Tax=[Bacillus] enclensis TaxID=1402860 RepID=A0A0V8HD29_9BACI|nr:hypothetical protein [[Bacillus] enclensis]KSU60343.1 transposase [[Bacillus] enclensis]SCC23395.1 hypothetical protein GA0061094_3307 [[Bacillus] enclensis]
MKRKFIESLYETIVKDDLVSYQQLLETAEIVPKTDEYWKSAIGLYNSLTEEKKTILLRIIEQIQIDTISHLLGIMDGSSTLNGYSAEPSLLLDSKKTDGELQNLFLELIEMRDEESPG